MRRLGKWKVVSVETSWRHVLKTSPQRLGDKQNVYWRFLYLQNLNLYLTNLYLTTLYLTNLRKIQNALIRTQQFQYSSYSELCSRILSQGANQSGINNQILKSFQRYLHVPKKYRKNYYKLLQELKNYLSSK